MLSLTQNSCRRWPPLLGRLTIAAWYRRSGCWALLLIGVLLNRLGKDIVEGCGVRILKLTHDTGHRHGRFVHFRTGLVALLLTVDARHRRHHGELGLPTSDDVVDSRGLQSNLPDCARARVVVVVLAALRRQTFLLKRLLAK